MFNRWYVYETDAYFVSHDKAHHTFIGPYSKSEARRIALWRMNQAMRIGELVNVDAVHSAVKLDTEQRIKNNEVP